MNINGNHFSPTLKHSNLVCVFLLLRSLTWHLSKHHFLQGICTQTFQLTFTSLPLKFHLPTKFSNLGLTHFRDINTNTVIDLFSTIFSLLLFFKSIFQSDLCLCPCKGKSTNRQTRFTHTHSHKQAFSLSLFAGAQSVYKNMLIQLNLNNLFCFYFTNCTQLLWRPPAQLD